MSAIFGSVIAGLGIGFYYSYLMTFASFIAIPILAFANIFQKILMESKESQSFEKIDDVLNETIQNIKNSWAINSYIKQFNNYVTLKDQINFTKKWFIKNILISITIGLNNFNMFLVFGLLFYINSVISVNNSVEIYDNMVAMFAIIYLGFSLGFNAEYFK